MVRHPGLVEHPAQRPQRDPHAVGAAGAAELPAPADVRLTKRVTPEARSRQNTSRAPLLSLATRLAASLTKATYWPLLLTTGLKEAPAPLAAPAALMLTSSKSRTTAEAETVNANDAALCNPP